MSIIANDKCERYGRDIIYLCHSDSIEYIIAADEFKFVMDISEAGPSGVFKTEYMKRVDSRDKSEVISFFTYYNNYKIHRLQDFYTEKGFDKMIGGCLVSSSALQLFSLLRFFHEYANVNLGFNVIRHRVVDREFLYENLDELNLVDMYDKPSGEILSLGYTDCCSDDPEEQFEQEKEVEVVVNVREPERDTLQYSLF
jgi:hypothetical protein